MVLSEDKAADVACDITAFPVRWDRASNTFAVLLYQRALSICYGARGDGGRIDRFFLLVATATHREATESSVGTNFLSEPIDQSRPPSPLAPYAINNAATNYTNRPPGTNAISPRWCHS